MNGYIYLYNIESSASRIYRPVRLQVEGLRRPLPMATILNECGASDWAGVARERRNYFRRDGPDDDASSS